MSEVYDKLKEIVQNAMHIDLDTIDKNKNIDEISEWDSFQNLMITSEIESTFKIKINSAELSAMKTVRKIIEVIESKLAP